MPRRSWPTTGCATRRTRGPDGLPAVSRIFEPGSRGVAERGHAHLGRERASPARRRGGPRLRKGGDQARGLGQHPLLQRRRLGDHLPARGSVKGRLVSSIGSTERNAQSRASIGVSAFRRAGNRVGQAVAECSSPSNNASRLSGKCRKNVRSVTPALAAISAASSRRSRARGTSSRAACCRRRRACSPLRGIERPYPYCQCCLYDYMSVTDATRMM